MTTSIIPAQSDQVVETLAVPEATTDYRRGYDSGPGLREFLKLFWRYWHYLLLMGLLGFALGYLLSKALTPEYIASGSIRIDTEPVQFLDYGLDAQSQRSRPNHLVYFQTQFKLMRSRKLATRVIDELQLDESLQNASRFSPEAHAFSRRVVAYKNRHFKASGADDHAETAPGISSEQRFLERLRIRPVKDSQIIEVSYRAETAELATTVVNGFMDVFIRQNLEGQKSAASEAEDFLRVELEEARAKLQQSEAGLLEYARQQNILDTGGDRSVIAQSLEGLSAAYIKAKEQRIIAQSLYDKKKNASGELYVADSSLISQLKGRLSQLNTQYKEDLKTFKPGYPAMQALQAQINDLKGQIQREARNARKSVAEDLRAAFLSAQQQEQRLSGEMRAYERKLLNYEDKNLQYLNLQRDVETDRAHYQGLLQRLKEVTVAAGSGVENISVIDYAVPPVFPVSPRLLLNVVIGTVVGLFLGGMLALLRGFTNTRIQSIEELEKLNLPYPILTSLPNVKRVRKKEIPLLAARQPRSAMAESIRFLYQNLTLPDVSTRPKHILVTSALAGEGKSSMVVNLAGMLAKSGKRVLVVDGDLRKPMTHQYLAMSNKVGLSSFLAGQTSKMPIQRVSKKFPLFVLPAGPAVRDPVRLLSSQRMISLLEQARSTFDHIIVDSPPVLGMADALVLSNRADATVFVVSRNKPTADDVRKALNNMKKGLANIVGVVFSRDDDVANQYYHTHDYSDGRELLT